MGGGGGGGTSFLGFSLVNWGGARKTAGTKLGEEGNTPLQY